MFASWSPRMSSTVIRYRLDPALGDLAINQTKKPQPFLVPLARCAGGESQLASLDGVSWIMGTLYYSAERLRRECLRLRLKALIFAAMRCLRAKGRAIRTVRRGCHRLLSRA